MEPLKECDDTGARGEGDYGSPNDILNGSDRGAAVLRQPFDEPLGKKELPMSSVAVSEFCSKCLCELCDHLGVVSGESLDARFQIEAVLL